MKRFLPNLTASMAVCMLVIAYIDDRNPMMGFLSSVVGKLYMVAFSVLGIATAVLLIREYRAEKAAPVPGRTAGKTSAKLVKVNGEDTLMVVTLTPLADMDEHTRTVIREKYMPEENTQ